MKSIISENETNGEILHPKYITDINEVTALSAKERERLGKVTQEFRFKSNDYYLSLIDWNDPNDPIRKIVLPNESELLEDSEWELDPSGEDDYTKVPSLQHKYRQVALLLVSDTCGGYCRFCFRKRLFIGENGEVSRDLTEAITYVREHSEISNVLLTGGDPLLLSTCKLRGIIQDIRKIEHVKVIRIGSKMLAFNPLRILNDPELVQTFSEFSKADRKIYLMAHFNHPKELTEHSVKAVNMLLKAGVVIVNQTPILRGINDNPDILSELFNRLSFIGVPPYYLFQCRPTKGNEIFSVPLETAYQIFEKALDNCSGISKRARFVMSHYSGKVEVVGMTDNRIFMRYHRTPENGLDEKFFSFERNNEAFWLNDYIGAGRSLEAGLSEKSR